MNPHRVRRSCKSFIGAGIKSLSGLDVTKFANAISDVLIERAKQELTIAFFDRFKKFAQENPEFHILFPKTTANLSNLLTYAYPQMLPKLRTGFLDDIAQISFNIEALLELPKYRTLLENFPEVRVAIRSLKLIHQLENGDVNAAQVIKLFSEFDEWKENGSRQFKNMSGTIQFAAIFSESLRSDDSTKIWVRSSDIEGLVKKEVFARVFLGLIYLRVQQQNIKYFLDPANPTTSTDLADLLSKQKDNILFMQNRIAQFIALAERVNDAYQNVRVKNRANTKLTKEDYFNYIAISLDAVDYSFSIVKTFDPRLQVDAYLDIARKSNDLYKSIYTEEYTQAISDAIDIIVSVQDLTKRQKNSTVTVGTSKVPGALPHDEASKDLLTFIHRIKPYAIFMANVIEAENEAAVKAALENAILPVGSSSIKKNTLRNVSVQAYLGAYLSTSNNGTISTSPWTDKFGVIAPIGISFTPGFLSWQKKGSLSLFGALFDVGAIVDYKLKKDSVVSTSGTSTSVVTKDYSVELGQIFSPGLYAVYGFPWNLPLSLGFGAQYGPGLSKIESGDNVVLNNPSWRWNFFLAVDLPLFNLVNKSKTK